MYNDLFSIGKLTVHSYGVLTAIALIAAILMATKRAKNKGLNEDICYGILFVGVLSGYFLSKVTYILVECDWNDFIEHPFQMLFSSGGFVVIGGMVGGIVGACIYCKIKKVSAIDYLDLCVPSIAIAQGFGRLGCFMAGCCHGKPTDSVFGIAFSHSQFAPNGVKLIPTQLISSAGNFLNMAILILISMKTKKKGVVSGAYIVIYSIGRFLVEFLRGDEVRGTIWVFSTSQFFSLILLPVGAAFMAWGFFHKEKEPVLETVDGEGSDVKEIEEEKGEAGNEEV